MERFLKYEIPTDRWLNDFQPLLIDKQCHVAVIGELVEGMTAIDIIWGKEPITEFNEYKVFPNGVGRHTFLGCDHLYEQEKLNNNV